MKVEHEYEADMRLHEKLAVMHLGLLIEPHMRYAHLTSEQDRIEG